MCRLCRSGKAPKVGAMRVIQTFCLHIQFFCHTLYLTFTNVDFALNIRYDLLLLGVSAISQFVLNHFDSTIAMIATSRYRHIQ